MRMIVSKHFSQALLLFAKLACHSVLCGLHLCFLVIHVNEY